MRRALAAALGVSVLVVGTAVVASTPEPTTPQSWCRVVDLATGDEVTVPCHIDPPPTTTTTTTTTTTVPPTTTTLPPTTTLPAGPVQTDATWSNVALGSVNVLSTITIPQAVAPNATGVTFTRNGTPNRTDATGPPNSVYQFYPGININAGDVLRATWTDLAGVQRFNEYVVPGATPATTTTAPPTTAAPATTVPSAAEFVETFNGGTQAEFVSRFTSGVFHRDSVLVDQTEWPADHVVRAGGDCSPPDQTHTVHRNAPEESFYVCASVDGDTTKGHLMTSVGDTSGYSIAFFKPNAIFNGPTTVEFDVNVTFLGTRQWWEVMIVPADAPDLACSSSLTACGLPTIGYPAGATVVSVDGLHSGGVSRDPWSPHWNYCYGPFRIDPTGCDSLNLRRTFTVTDNLNGTITFGMPDIGRSFTYPGSFPAGDWKVVFKDHNYTPAKDGIPVSYTWHFDNIVVS